MSSRGGLSRRFRGRRNQLLENACGTCRRSQGCRRLSWAPVTAVPHDPPQQIVARCLPTPPVRRAIGSGKSSVLTACARLVGARRGLLAGSPDASDQTCRSRRQKKGRCKSSRTQLKPVVNGPAVGFKTCLEVGAGSVEIRIVPGPCGARDP